MDHRLNRLNKKESLVWDRAYEKFCKTGEWDFGEEKMAKTIKVFGEVEMDMKQILENVQANIEEGDRCRCSGSPKKILADRYYGYAKSYLEAAQLLLTDEPVCFEHGRKKVLCNCGCGIHLCGFCDTEARQAEADKENAK